MRRVLTVLGLLLMVTSARAQTIAGCGSAPGTPVIDPKNYCFESPDWDDQSFGTSVIGNAKIYVYTQASGGTGTPLAVVDIGHTPALAGKTSDNYYVVKGAWARPSAVPADGTTLYVGIVEEALTAGGVKRSSPGNPFGYSRAPDSRPVKPPIYSQASPSKSPGLEPCTGVKRCGSLFASRAPEAAIGWSLHRSTRLAMGRAGGLLVRPRARIREPAAT